MAGGSSIQRLCQVVVVCQRRRNPSDHTHVNTHRRSSMPITAPRAGTRMNFRLKTLVGDLQRYCPKKTAFGCFHINRATAKLAMGDGHSKGRPVWGNIVKLEISV